MPRPKRVNAPWLSRAVALVVRLDTTLAAAALEYGHSLSVQQIEEIEKTVEYQKMISVARDKWAEELASDPSHNKRATIGKLKMLAAKLDANAQYEKAADVLLKMSKLENWVGADTNVSVIGGLTAAEMAEVREELQKQKSSVEVVDEAGETVN
jgi:hypothetical protein